MKLIKKGNVDSKNSSLFCVLLLFCYFVLPYLCSFILPKNFYVFSTYKDDADYAVLLGFVISFLFFYTILRLNRWANRLDYLPRLSVRLLYLFYLFFIAQLIALALSGTYFRFIAGISDRDILLEKEHVFLFSGTSYIFVCGFFYLATFSKNKALLFIGFLCIYIDVLFMGKKFVFYLIGVLLYRYDVSSKKTSVKPFFYACCLGAGFLVLIYLVRAVTSDSSANILIDVYALFSEFIGVYATVGWAYEYHEFVNGWWKVVQELGDFYRAVVGHGLALHPVAYFIAVFGSNWVVAMFVYLLGFALIYYLASMLIGSAAILVLLVNIMHFMRHGPEIFLQQFTMQAIFLIFIIYLPKMSVRNAQ